MRVGVYFSTTTTTRQRRRENEITIITVRRECWMHVCVAFVFVRVCVYVMFVPE